MSAPLVIIGQDDHEFDCEIDEGQRLAVGLLGVEVRDRWNCTRCGYGGCIVYVERYDEKGAGSSFALCALCAFDVLDPRTMRARFYGEDSAVRCSTAGCKATAAYEAEIEDHGWHPYCDDCTAPCWTRRTRQETTMREAPTPAPTLANEMGETAYWLSSAYAQKDICDEWDWLFEDEPFDKLVGPVWLRPRWTTDVERADEDALYELFGDHEETGCDTSVAYEQAAPNSEGAHLYWSTDFPPKSVAVPGEEGTGS